MAVAPAKVDCCTPDVACMPLQIALVAGIVAVAVFIGRLGEPIVENTVKSFPSPAAYEAYEETK